MTLTNEVRFENCEARYVDGHMQIKLQFNFIELSPKKVLSHLSQNITLTSSLRF